MQPGELGRGDRRPVRVQRRDQAREFRAVLQVDLGPRDRGRVGPHRPAEPEHEIDRVAAGWREVLDEQGLAPGRVSPRRSRDPAAEVGGPVGHREPRQHREPDQADEQRSQRAAGHPAGHPTPGAAGPLPGGRLGRPEQRPAEDGQHGRHQREPGQDHQRDPDGQRHGQAVIDAEGGEQQAEQGGDDRSRGEHDRLAHPLDAALDGLVMAEPAPAFLPHPEDQEQPVVGPRPQHEHDEQQLGDARDPDPETRHLGHHGLGGEQHEHGGQQRRDRSQRRAEHREQDHDDKQDRQVLGSRAQPARLAGLVSGHGEIARGMQDQPGRRAGRTEQGPQRADEGDVRRVRLLRERGPDLDQGGLAVTGQLSDPRGPGLREPSGQGRQAGDSRIVGPAEPLVAAGGRHHEGVVVVGRAVEGGGQAGGDVARRAGRQELRVVVVHRGGQRRQERRRGHGAADPGGDDEPAVPDGHASEHGEQRTHQSGSPG